MILFLHGRGSGEFSAVVFNMVAVWVEKRRRKAQVGYFNPRVLSLRELLGMLLDHNPSDRVQFSPEKSNR